MSLAADEQINPVGGGVRLEGLEEPTPGPRRWIAHVLAIVGLVACDHAPGRARAAICRHLVGHLWSRKCARCFVMDPALWPAKDGSTGITSAKEMDAAEQANKAIKVGSNSFLFFSS